MSDSEKPKSSWRERRKAIIHKLLTPFIFGERICEHVLRFLKKLAFFEILEYVGRLAVVVGVIFYFLESKDRQKAKHYQAWQIINTAQGQTGSGGRIDALQDLNRDGVSLAGVDISNAYLSELNLSGAGLMDANLSGADLRFANLSEAYLSRANLSEAALYEAELTNIRGWQNITSIEFANICGVKTPPEGFIEWAKEHGAVSIEDRREWEKLLREKMQEKTKQK